MSTQTAAASAVDAPAVPPAVSPPPAEPPPPTGVGWPDRIDPPRIGRARRRIRFGIQSKLLVMLLATRHSLRARRRVRRLYVGKELPAERRLQSADPGPGIQVQVDHRLLRPAAEFAGALHAGVHGDRGCPGFHR